jgi:hypothetical protein
MAAINGVERCANVVISAVRSNCSTRVEPQDSCIWCFFNVIYFNDFFFVSKRDVARTRKLSS